MHPLYTVPTGAGVVGQYGVLCHVQYDIISCHGPISRYGVYGMCDCAMGDVLGSMAQEREFEFVNNGDPEEGCVLRKMWWQAGLGCHVIT